MEEFKTLEEAKKWIEDNQRKIDSYERKLNYIKQYDRNHPEKTNAKQMRHYYKIKEDPEKYAKLLEKRREYYKKRQEKKKEEKENLKKI